MKKFRLLLLDANAVIEISRHSLWDRVVAACEVHLAQTVIDEAQFFQDENGERQEIDLAASVNAGTIGVFNLIPADLTSFRATFAPAYLEKLDPGETESLAYLLSQPEECRLCSADKIVFRILGSLNRAEQGISLEEVLHAIGLSRKLSRQFTRQYRKEWTNNGFQEGLRGGGDGR